MQHLRLPLAVLLLLAVFLCGCDIWIFQVKPKNSTAVPQSITVIGSPSVKSSAITLSIIPMDTSNSGIKLTGSNVCFYIDSARTSSGAKTTYTMKTTGVVNSPSVPGGLIASQMIFDGSGSIASSDPRSLRKSAGKAFISVLAANNPLNKVAIAEFGNSLDSLNPDTSLFNFHLWCNFTSASNTAKLFPYLDSLSASSNTPLYTSVIRGIQHTDSIVPAAKYARSLIVFTDGMDNSSLPSDTLSHVIEVAKSKGMPITIVGLGGDVSLDTMQKLAWTTGGIFVPVDSASALTNVFSTLATGISTGYSNISAAFNRNPEPGDILYFTMKIISNDQETTKHFKYVVYDPLAKKRTPSRSLYKESADRYK
jgi:hypothetical protein